VHWEAQHLISPGLQPVPPAPHVMAQLAPRHSTLPLQAWRPSHTTVDDADIVRTSPLQACSPMQRIVQDDALLQSTLSHDCLPVQFTRQSAPGGHFTILQSLPAPGLHVNTHVAPSHAPPFCAHIAGHVVAGGGGGGGVGVVESAAPLSATALPPSTTGDDAPPSRSLDAGIKTGSSMHAINTTDVRKKSDSERTAEHSSTSAMECIRHVTRATFDLARERRANVDRASIGRAARARSALG